MKLTGFVSSTILAAGAACASGPFIDPGSITFNQDSATHRVDIGYTLSGTNAIVTLDIETNVTGTAEGPWVSIGAEHVRALAGEVNKVVRRVGEPVSIIWLPEVDWPGQSVPAGSIRAVLTAWDLANPPDYMSVDLGGVTYAPCRRFYTCEAAVPGDLRNSRTPERSSRILMRKIPAKGVTWRMGAPLADPERNVVNESYRVVTFTHDYYMAIYETTIGQWGGGGWSYASGMNDQPAYDMSYDAVRGTGLQWPQDGHAVDEGTPIAAIRGRTGIDSFDLPTEAQWEFACRAGTSQPWANGEWSVPDDMCWYLANSGGARRDVGTKKPNAWGLYDMHGNVLELCLDWRVNPYDPEDVIDPTGPATGTQRCKRGGCTSVLAVSCRSSARDSDPPNLGFSNCGFRLVCGANVNDYRDFPASAE